MDRITILICILACIVHCEGEVETILSAVLTPGEKTLLRQERSYYDRYGYERPYDRLEDRPSRCGRCNDDDDDDDDDYDRGRGRDDDRRSNRPTYRSDRNDRNKYDDDDTRRYDDRNDRNNKNGTDDNDDKKQHDDKDGDRPHRRRNKNRGRHDDRDRYRPDYYDRFLRDPYRDRYDDPYRRPVYDRYYPDRYDDYGRDGYYSGYRRPVYDDRYERGSGYYDAYGGYGPGVGRGPHDSFRPWDETYRGQAGWDSGGRGYYFASGRPDATASTWGQQQYARPASSGGGWQSIGHTGGYSGGYRDPGYRSSAYAGAAGGYQDVGAGGYGQSSGWRNVGERRPYRDQSGVAHLDTKVTQEQDAAYNRYGQNRPVRPLATYQPAATSSTPGTSYLFQRGDSVVTQPETTVAPS